MLARTRHVDIEGTDDRIEYPRRRSMHTSSPIPTTEWVGSNIAEVGARRRALGRYALIKKIDVIRLRERSCRFLFPVFLSFSY
jgi:hypothetical protein